MNATIECRYCGETYGGDRCPGCGATADDAPLEPASLLRRAVDLLTAGPISPDAAGLVNDIEAWLDTETEG